MEGWICPRCQKVLAPWVKECDCLPPCQDSPYPWTPMSPSSWPSIGDSLPPPNTTKGE